MEQYVFGGALGSGAREETRFRVYTPITTTTTTTTITTTTTSTRAPGDRRGRMLDSNHFDFSTSGINSVPSNSKKLLAQVNMNKGTKEQ